MVQAFRERSYSVRALVRPAARVEDLRWGKEIEVFRADLRTHPNLAIAFEGADALIHLASAVIGDEDEQFTSTVVGTERLLEAMTKSSTWRLILASSFSVYGWSSISRTLDEESPLEAKLYERGGYAIAKMWQERVTRRKSAALGWDLTVLRPGFIWGQGNEYLPSVSSKVGPFHIVFGVWRRLPLTYVENCARFFVKALEDPKSIGQTINLLDSDEVRAWQYIGEILRRTGRHGIRIGTPFFLLNTLSIFSTGLSKLLFKGKGKLPSLLMPCRLAVLKPLRFSNRKLCNELGWSPRFDFRESLARCFARKEGLQ